jgi:hypothetical protein
MRRGEKTTGMLLLRSKAAKQLAGQIVGVGCGLQTLVRIFAIADRSKASGSCKMAVSQVKALLNCRSGPSLA